MSLIDGDKLLVRSINVGTPMFPRFVSVVYADDILAAPTVPAEIVVHCRDCRKRNTPRCNMTHNMGGGRFLTCNEDLGYCNFAEMKPIKIDKARKANEH